MNPDGWDILGFVVAGLLLAAIVRIALRSGAQRGKLVLLVLVLFGAVLGLTARSSIDRAGHNAAQKYTYKWENLNLVESKFNAAEKPYWDLVYRLERQYHIPDHSGGGSLNGMPPEAPPPVNFFTHGIGNCAIVMIETLENSGRVSFLIGKATQQQTAFVFHSTRYKMWIPPSEEAMRPFSIRLATSLILSCRPSKK